MRGKQYRDIPKLETALLEGVEQARRASLGDPVAALLRAERSERRTRQRGDSVGVCAATLLRGHLLSTLGHHEQAIELFDRSIEQSRAEGWERVGSACLCAVAEVQVRMARYEEAHGFIELALEIALRRQDHRREAQCRVQLADVYRRLGDVAGAHVQADLAMKIAEQEDDGALQVGALNVRSAVLAALGLWSEAVDVQQRALKLSEEHALLDERLTLLGNIGLTMRRCGALEESERYYALLLQCAREANRQGSIGIGWLGIGDLCAGARQYGKAEQAYSEAMEIFSKLNVRNNAVRAMCGVAEMSRLQGDRARARTMLEAAWKEAEEIASPALHASLRGELSRLHRSMAVEHDDDPLRAAEHYHIALDHAEACMALHSTLRSAEVQRAVLAAAMRDRISQLERALEEEHQRLMVHAAEVVEKNAAFGDLLNRIRALRCKEPETLRSALPELEACVLAAMRVGEHWEGFERQFRALHPDFIGLLSRHHPLLTATERRVCMLLRVTLSTKDVAGLLGVSVESVEKYRHRIRRKIGLPQQTNLTTYLASL